ncbi:hypothetical protein GCM10022281_18060 [Sphingomonas rosea]|uniref:Lipoprotein n=1 Tax=Sphingomonas rosea TaxID=335605 RepID=A0ABP7UAI5_9SPHN
MALRLLGICVLGFAVAGCGPAVTQRFEASPSATYAAFEQAWGKPSKDLRTIDGKSVVVAYDYEKVEGKRLEAIMTIDGEEAAMVGLEMVAADEGKATDVQGTIRIDDEKFRKATGATDMPPLNGMLANMALKSLLAEASKQMKVDGTLGYGGPFGSLSSRARQASTDPEEREMEARSQAYAASRPMVSTRGASTAGASTAPMIDPSKPTGQSASGY